MLADLSSWLADVAARLDLTSQTIDTLEGRIRELQESPPLGFTTFIDTAQISAIETKLEELHRARDQTQARIVFLEGPPDTGASAPVPDFKALSSPCARQTILLHKS